MQLKLKCMFLVFVLGITFQIVTGQNSDIVSEDHFVIDQQDVTIVYDATGSTLDSISAYLLARDIEVLSGK